MNWLTGAPRRTYALVAAICAAMLAFGMYLQHVQGLEPCPMCIVQRYALVLVGVFAALAAFTRRSGLQKSWAVLGLLAAGGGAFTAARQSWLQWYPPELGSCGRDIYGMIESFPLRRAIPMIFQGSGDCSAVDWTFLGLTIANWGFVWFAIFAVVFALLLVRRASGPTLGQHAPA